MQDEALHKCHLLLLVASRMGLGDDLVTLRVLERPRNGCNMGTLLGKLATNMPNRRICSTGLGTLWGTWLFGLSGLMGESSSSSSSPSYGPPLAGCGWLQPSLVRR